MFGETDPASDSHCERQQVRKTEKRRWLICCFLLVLQHIQCLHSCDYLRWCNLTFFCFRNWEFLNCLLLISLKMYLYWVNSSGNSHANVTQAGLQYSHVNITHGQWMTLFPVPWKCSPLSTFLFGLQCLSPVQNHLLMKGCSRYNWSLSEVKDFDLTCSVWTNYEYIKGQGGK